MIAEYSKARFWRRMWEVWIIERGSIGNTMYSVWMWLRYVMNEVYVSCSIGIGGGTRQGVGFWTLLKPRALYYVL